MIRTLIAAALAAALAVPAVAEDWTPPGPITLKIAFRAGGGADTQARLIADELEARHGWQIIPENVTGRGGAVLAADMVDDPADGTVIGMVVTETFGYNRAATRNPGYTIEDFTFLTTTAGFQMGIVALAGSGYETFADVIAAAEAGEEISFGAMSQRLADGAYLLGRENGVAFNVVGGLRGGRGVMNALTAGDIDIGWVAGIQAGPVQAGEMVNLASGIGRPLDISPDAPLTADFGVPYSMGGNFVFVAPAGLSDEAAAAITAAIVEIVEDPATEVNQFISRGFGGTEVVTGDALLARVEEEAAQAEAMLADAAN